MKQQCTSCDKIVNDDDLKFCRSHRHEIIDVLDEKESSLTKTAKNSKITKKVKGKINELYVESIFVDGKPRFLCTLLNQKLLTIKESIETDDLIFKPLESNECGYFPYSFSSQEILSLMDQEITKEELLDEIKVQIDRYLSLRDIEKHLILGDVFLTYCQEWVNTLHYPFFVGETESGKSTVLHFVKWLGYRCMLGEDIPQADVYNFLGSDEEGTGTIAEDEAQELWKNSEKIRTYKSSYSKGSTKARIVGVDSLGKHQVFYKTFCPKWFAGEKIPQDKGFLERLAIVHMTEGQPQSNIKRLTDDEKTQLHQLRNKLLVWKVQNMTKGLERIETGLKQRDAELWDDFLSVVNGTKYFDKCKNVATYYTEQRHEVIKNSLEAKLFKFVLEKIDQNLELTIKSFWDFITDNNPEFSGKLDGMTFYPEDFPGKITTHSIAKILEDKFQAEKTKNKIRDENKIQHQVTSYSFKKDVIETFVKKYGIELALDSPFYIGEQGEQGSQRGEIVHQGNHVNQVAKEES